ncbi:FAD/NAD(P)-binding domain-containing protein [Macrolepiota fuliginosa MF-IS2]|uniref:NADPH:adrenodoxin oxidoreductase, mitochondrial n=1 Tax=Macrolepiota fuliginosa MF-IS2 TaxID=1400762 RepID=A0A9P5XAG9_9AGAR|nr:FAD/NAD(P)-binding domain-containing protein [Macrolepiota fuliginosa MF-IS2]
MPLKPLKLAVIGGGPSAFYVASRILSLVPNANTSPPVRVHLFDRLWAPHGLVRYGVAPDHPEVKNCTHKFDATASDPRFRFFGNINIGDAITPISHTHKLSLSSIFNSYSHVLFATGCTLPTLHSALPPSQHCIPALSLVHWYTQHPNRSPPPALDKISHVSLIGNGNVSLDVARMLLTPVSTLAQYDVPESVLDVLSRSSVRHVSIIGRRGPLEAAFTTKELRELINLPDASMVPIEPSFLKPSPDLTLSRQQSRTLQLLSKGSKNAFGSTPKTWSLDFYRSPTGLIVDPSDPTTAELSLAHTMVDPRTQRAVSTGESSTLPTSLVVTSLGFHGEPTASFYDPGLGHLRTLGARIITNEGHALKNMYASGWAATGAKGVLASTMMNAYAAADTVLGDVLPDREPEEPKVLVEDILLNPNPDLDGVPREVAQGLKEGSVTQYGDWKKIDEEEIKRGQAVGKERERMNWEDARKFLETVRDRSPH